MPGDRLQRILVWLIIIAVAVFLLERLFALMTHFATPLLLFGLAWLIALTLQPAVERLTNLDLPKPLVSRRAVDSAVWRMPRGLAVLLVYLALLAVIIVLVISLVPVIGSQLVGVETTLPNAIDQIAGWFSGIEEELQRFGYRGDLERIVQPEALAQQVGAVGSTVVEQSLTIASSIATLLINLILVLILSFYMTLDGPRLTERILEILPQTWRADTLRLFSIMNNTFGGFLRAQLVQSVIYGLATALLMGVMGISYVALASVLAAIVVLIPLIGGVTAMVPPLVIVLIEAPDRFLFMLIALVIVQQVLFNVIMPRLMGQIVGLHPLLVFAAILVGATLAGGWGLFFGIPIAGVIGSVLQFVYMRAIARNASIATPLSADE